MVSGFVIEIDGESESRFQDRVVAYLKEEYPKARFISSLAGEKNSHRKTRSRIAKIQHSNGQPDMFLFKRVGKYVGLAIELKKDTANPYRKDGKLKAGQHLKEQKEWLDYLKEEGWYAVFSCGVSDTIELIDKYLNDEL